MTLTRHLGWEKADFRAPLSTCTVAVTCPVGPSRDAGAWRLSAVHLRHGDECWLWPEGGRGPVVLPHHPQLSQPFATAAAAGAPHHE